MSSSKRGRKYREVAQKVDKSREYTLDEALNLAKEIAYTKFPATIEFHGVLNLSKGVDPRSIRADLALPHSYKSSDVKVAVAVPVDLKEKAQEAGADVYDFEEIKKQIESGKIEFDVLLAVPQVMPELAKYGKELGPKGLMPNAKSGTIINNISNLKSVIEEFKRGKLTIKADKTGVVHFGFGTIEMDNNALKENLNAVLSELAKSANKSKERLFKRAYITVTMGPSIKLSLSSLV